MLGRQRFARHPRTIVRTVMRLAASGPSLADQAQFESHWFLDNRVFEDPPDRDPAPSTNLPLHGAAPVFLSQGAKEAVVTDSCPSRAPGGCLSESPSKVEDEGMFPAPDEQAIVGIGIHIGNLAFRVVLYFVGPPLARRPST